MKADVAPQLPAAEDLSQWLIILGSSSASKPFLIRHLLTVLGGVAERLWRALQVTPPPSLFFFCCFDFSLLL